MALNKKESVPANRSEHGSLPDQDGLLSALYIPYFDRRIFIEVLLRSSLDIAIYQILLICHLTSISANIISFFSSTLLIFPFHLRRPQERGAIREGGIFVLIALLAFFVRVGVLSLAQNKWGLGSFVAIIPALLAGSFVLYAGGQLAHKMGDDPQTRRHRWNQIITSLVAYLLLFRLIYIGAIELIPEEVYYWNYSQHLDWGYLDHPPMVAWTIKAGTMLFGNTEFGVRIGAVISWVIAAGFTYGITKEWFGRQTAIISLILMSVLPFFFGIGAILTPDAPLTAFWAGIIYFSQRAILKNCKNMWWLAGVCLGLGMLSKYTIALLVPAMLIYLIFDSRARFWLRRLQPNLAVLIGIILFLPVIYWNSKHEWVSFLFQTTRRIGEPAHFSPHLLLGSILFLITPFGLWSAGQALTEENPPKDKIDSFGRIRPFVLIMTIFPLAIFLIFSLTHEPKLNWTGPLWLATIPGISFILNRLSETRLTSSDRITHWGWMTTIFTFTLIYGFSLSYLSPGYPIVKYSQGMRDVAGWSDLGKKVYEVVREVEQNTGTKPLVVGMDKYNIASELAFYNSENGPEETSSAHLFGHNGLMYKYWFPPESVKGKTIVMVGRDAGSISDKEVGKYFDHLDHIQEFEVTLNGKKVTTYCCRVGFGYNPSPLE